nr:MAG TPA: hypothetical protein [Caudoviricetes sp.]
MGKGVGISPPPYLALFCLFYNVKRYNWEYVMYSVQS